MTTVNCESSGQPRGLSTPFQSKVREVKKMQFKNGGGGGGGATTIFTVNIIFIISLVYIIQSLY